MKNFYVSVFLCLSGAAFAQAPLLIDDFNYSTGDLLTAQGWESHSGTTTNPIVATSPGLTFTGYVGSAVGLSAGVNNTGQDLIKSFGAQTSGVIYSSFLVNASDVPAAGVYFFHYLQTSGSTAHRGRTFISSTTDAGKMLVGLTFNSSTAVNSTTVLNMNQTYLMVLKYDIQDGIDNDKVSLYVFAVGDDFATEPATPFLGPFTGTAADISPTYVTLRQDAASQRITVDGIRVKKHWQLSADDPASTINPEGNNELSLFYPNPVVDGYLQLSSKSEGLKKISVYDFVGKKVLETVTVSQKIDISILRSGMYMLQVTAGNKTAFSKLLVK